MAFASKNETAVIKQANILSATISIKGVAPYIQHRFWKKGELMDAMTKTKAEKKGKSERKPRDYDEEMRSAMHIAVGGWTGIPCTALRSAMIDACRTVGLVMTKAKMSVFVMPDGFDERDGTPLVRLLSPAGPERHDAHTRNDNGSIDIRVRPMWREWGAAVQVEFDADMITPESVVNLLDRAGRQVGIGEGRPYSKMSVGQGWGTFRVVNG